MGQLKGLIFDIQGFAVHDGPGTRTLVFLSGCPLRCAWCANPEGIRNRQNLLFAAGQCKAVQNNCRRCIESCSRGAISLDPDSGLPQIERSLCEECTTFECAAACNYEALRKSGRYYTVAELMEVLQRDRNFWGGDGGVTFSGGEPLAQSAFLQEALSECKRLVIHTAIETSAYANRDLFLRTMRDVDFAFIDIKHMDSSQHKLKTGVGNERILGNLEALAASGWPGRLILRSPVIPEFNDSEENARAVIAFMKQNGFFEINLLPFHRLGTSKWEQLGKTYPYGHMESGKKEDLSALQQIYLDAGIVCYVDTDVVYKLHRIDRGSF